MKLSNDLILHKLTPFLDLFDIAIILQVSKSIHRLRRAILGELDYVVVTNRTMIPHLVCWCPKVKRLKITTFRSEDVGYLECLPIESLDCYSEYTSNPQVNFPKLRKLHIHKFNSVEFPDFHGHLTTGRFREDILDLQLESLQIEDYLTPDFIARLCDKKLPVTSLKAHYLNNDTIEKMKELPLRSLSLMQKSDSVSNLELLNIEELVVSFPSEITFISRMSLKKLDIKCDPANSVDSIKFNNTLESLTMYGMVVYMEDLELPNLKYLSLASCRLRRRTAPHTLKLTITQLKCATMFVESDIIADTLTKLSITICRTDPDLIARLPNTITDLKIIGCMEIDCNKLQLSNLTVLELCGNYAFDVRLSDAGLRWIAKNKISDLTFKNVDITDDNIHHLADMPINYLTLIDCNFSIVGLNRLRGLPLRQLKVSGIPARHLFIGL